LQSLTCQLLEFVYTVGFPLHPNIVKRNEFPVTEGEQMLNYRMSQVRVTVEWQFGQIIRLWAYVDFKKNMRVLVQPVGAYYLLACILSNAHCCLYGNEVSQYFDLDPPDLLDYLHVHA
jgi:nuclease HARBI1